jgi:toxin-antitoxin system PIN domain toxin
VKIPDVNVLLNASDQTAHHHAIARRWLETALSSSERVGLTWLVLLGFLRVSTNPRVYDHPLTVTDALDLIDEWIDLPSTGIVAPMSSHQAVLRGLIEAAGTAANLTTDAHLAALAIEHGATLATFDGDFHRFSGLKLEYLG